VQPESGDSGVTDKDLLLADPSATNQTLERQKRLDSWLRKWDFLWKVRLGKYGEEEFLRHGGDDGIHRQIRAVEAVILRNLAKLNGDSSLSRFYKSVAKFMENLTRKPLPRFINDAPSIESRRLGKRKIGRPQSLSSDHDEVEPLQILDAIAKLATATHGRFLYIKNPVIDISNRLGISRDALRARRQKVSSKNVWIERLKSEWGNLSPVERSTEAEKRIRNAVDRLLMSWGRGNQRGGEK
jgi:hypothetical protein